MYILPNGKIIENNNNLYQSNLLRLLNQNDLNTINANISNINTQLNNKVNIGCGTYTGNGTTNLAINLNIAWKMVGIYMFFNTASTYNSCIFYIPNNIKIGERIDGGNSLSGNSQYGGLYKYNGGYPNINLEYSYGDNILNYNNSVYYYYYIT